MKKGVKFTTGISIQVLILGIIGFSGTFIHDYMVSGDYFGDYEVMDRFDRLESVWGARHHWYVWTLAFLVLAQVTRIIMYSVSFWDEDARELLN